MDFKVSGQHVSQVVAPVLAAFTLPTIALIALSPPAHWANLMLSLFVASTGLLLAGFQLSVGRLFRDEFPWNQIRSSLTYLGLICLAAGLGLLTVSQTTREGRPLLYAALVILTLGVLVPIAINLIWLQAAWYRQKHAAVALPQGVISRLGKDRDIQDVQMAGSRASGQARPQSDWEFRIQTESFAKVMDRLPALVERWHPIVAQWDRLSSNWCYMLILAGPVKVDLIFAQPHAALPPWRVTAGTLSGIDDHFWDWMLWLSSKRAAGQDDLLIAEFRKLHEHLLGPLGAATPPPSVDQAICDYRQMRSEWEAIFELQVSRAAEHAVIPALHP